MAAWHIRHGRWWMLQWSCNGWLSLGVHVDFRTRPARGGLTYGPYVDVHLGPVIVSVGNRPVYSGNLEASTSVARGGVRAE